jgi:hypothetical protein
VIGNAGPGVNIAGLTVNGNGFSVNGNEFMRVFYIAGTSSTSVVINDLTIKGGSITVIAKSLFYFLKLLIKSNFDALYRPE